jgi:hypothetical protein
MNLSNIKATTGLTSKAIPSSTNVVGTVQIGANPETNTLTATVAYSLQAFFSASGNVLSLNHLTGSTTGSTAYVAGNEQVETATAAGTVTTAGNATVTVTSAGMTGSPKAISVAVALSDTPTLWAAKVRTALTADTDVGGRFTVSGSTTAIILTRKPSSSLTLGDITHHIHPVTDATLNVAIATGTAVGITAAATSANTTAGVATTGVLIYDGDGKDFEGTTIPTMTSIAGELFKTLGSAFVVDGNVDDLFTIGTNGNTMFVPGLAETTYTFTPTGPSAIQITVFGNV